MSGFRLLWMVLFFYMSAPSLRASAVDPFVDTTQRLTGVQLERVSGTPNTYKIPVFPETNRNHWDDRAVGVQVRALVLHHTACNCLKTLGLFTLDATQNRVSAHYVVTEYEASAGVLGGKVVAVVPEKKRAWHAGLSRWQDVTTGPDGKDLLGLNHASIGIECVNFGFQEPVGSGTWAPFDDNQIRAVGALCQDIVARYGLDPTCVVSHADIAPGRKFDPGLLFPWERLHRDYGVGAWLLQEERSAEHIRATWNPVTQLPGSPDATFMTAHLKAFGYHVDQGDYSLDRVMLAFKLHYSCHMDPRAYADALNFTTKTPGRPAHVTMQDMIWIWGLCAKYGRQPKSQ